MAQPPTQADASAMNDHLVPGTEMRRVRWLAMALTVTAIGLAACGGDDGDETTAPEAANAGPRPDAVDLSGYLMRDDEEPGFRAEAAPGATPSSPDSITGVEAFVTEMHLTPADERRLRREGFVSFTAQPIRGPGAAGISNIALYETAKGARRSLAHELRPAVVREPGPVENLRYFRVSGVPGARGWTASRPGEPASRAVGNIYWVQGRCVLVLGNQGRRPLVGPLSTGARAIFERTNRQCPCNGSG
jgi:hypothetical protein